MKCSVKCSVKCSAKCSATCDAKCDAKCSATCDAKCDAKCDEERSIEAHGAASCGAPRVDAIYRRGARSVSLSSPPCCETACDAAHCAHSVARGSLLSAPDQGVRLGSAGGRRPNRPRRPQFSPSLLAAFRCGFSLWLFAVAFRSRFSLPLFAPAFRCRFSLPLFAAAFRSRFSRGSTFQLFSALLSSSQLFSALLSSSQLFSALLGSSLPLFAAGFRS